MTKEDLLREQIRQYGRVAIAYSGGCDSDFLWTLCKDVLGEENVLPIFVRGPMISEEDATAALGRLEGTAHLVLELDTLSIPAFRHNARDRCYWCKHALMKQIQDAAHQRGFDVVIDGQNADDQAEYRPGKAACQELGIVSPMARVGLDKAAIRKWAKTLGVPTHDKPANACLASRFDYGTTLTRESLDRVAQAERYLHDLGVLHVRVRDMDGLARIECERKDWKKILEAKEFVDTFRRLGYRYVALDLNGITTGGYDRNGNPTNRL